MTAAKRAVILAAALSLLRRLREAVSLQRRRGPRGREAQGAYAPGADSECAVAAAGEAAAAEAIPDAAGPRGGTAATEGRRQKAPTEHPCLGRP